MLPYLTKYLMENWEAFSPQRDKPSSIDYLGILGSHEGGKISFLAFTKQNEKPLFIVKILRNPNFLRRLLNERDALSYLSSLVEFPGGSFPKVILCRKFSNTWCLLESILDGKLMTVCAKKNGLPNLKEAKINFDLAKNWLLAFNHRTKNETVISDNFIAEHIYQPIKEFEGIFSLNRLEEEYLRGFVDIIVEDHKGSRIDLLFQHGDFCPQNILLSKSKVGVIDWEFSQGASLPLYDLFFFLTTYYSHAMKNSKKADYLDCFEKSFFENNAYSNLIQQCVTEYCLELSIDAGLAKIFFSIFLLKKAIFEYHNLCGLSERGYLPLSWKSGKSYLDAIKDQLWINLFRFLVKTQDRLIFSQRVNE